MHLLYFLLIFVVMISTGGEGVIAKERIVMPYQCAMNDENQVILQPNNEPISYAILGPRDQRPFTACADGEGPDCRTVMVHQFEMSCSGHRVSWMHVAAAMKPHHESAPEISNGQLTINIAARRRGSEQLPWQSGSDRARVQLPEGYAPVGEIGARFVLPSTTGRIVVTPDSTSVDSYTQDPPNRFDTKVHKVANHGPGLMVNPQGLQSDADERKFFVIDDEAPLVSDIATGGINTADLSSWETVVNIGPQPGTGTTGMPWSYSNLTYIAGGLALFTLVIWGGLGYRRGDFLSLADRKVLGLKLEQFFTASNNHLLTEGAHGYGIWHGLSHHGANFLSQARRTIHNTSRMLASNLNASVQATSQRIRQGLEASSFGGGFTNQAYEVHKHAHARNGTPPHMSDTNNEQNRQFRSGMNVIEIGFHYCNEAVARLESGTPLRDVLTAELKVLRQRQGVLRATIADGTATPSRASATMRRLTCELERIRKIADSAVSSQVGVAPAGHATTTMPENPADSFALLGVNEDVPTTAVKKIVDGLRMSWHPDLARDADDRQAREAKIKQINVAWELIRKERDSQTLH